MNEMTLLCGHRIRNSSPGGLRPSTLPLIHRGSPQYCFTSGWGRNIYVSFNSPGPGTDPRNSSVKSSGANHYPRAVNYFLINIMFIVRIEKRQYKAREAVVF